MLKDKDKIFKNLYNEFGWEIDKSLMTEKQFLDKLKENGVSIIGMGQGKLRIVTHLDYTDGMHKSFLEILRKL